MPFIDDARLVFGSLISETKNLLEREQYVRRLAYREGEDASQAYQLYHLLTHSHEDNVLKDDEIAPGHRIALIGNSGSGKSLVLNYSFLKTAEAFLKQQESPVPFFLDLRTDLASDNDLRRGLDFKYEKLFSDAVKGHAVGCLLFLDGLDERILKQSPRFVKDLEFFLRDLDGRIVAFTIACRRAVWSPNWFQSLRLQTYHVDYLGDQDYAQILPDKSSRRDFFKSCKNLGISDLLSNPFDGFYLARKFAANQPLPRSRRECLDQRIRDSLDTTADSGELSPPVDRLGFWAQQLAWLSIVTGNDSYTPPGGSQLPRRIRSLALNRGPRRDQHSAPSAHLQKTR